MKQLNILLAAMLGVLSLSFVFGMVSNLYFEFPESADQKILMDASWKDWATATHMVLGVVILVLGIMILVHGVRSKISAISAMSIVGFLAIAVAAVAGDRFVRVQSEGWSFTMALGFIVAMGVYGRLMAAVQGKITTPTISS